MVANGFSIGKLFYEEDQEFARRLFRRAILNCDYYRHLISENTRNWDLDRVAFMDVVIMQCALADVYKRQPPGIGIRLPNSSLPVSVRRKYVALPRRQIYTLSLIHICNRGADGWKFRHRYSLEGTLSARVQRVKLSLRERFQHTFDGHRDEFRLRCLLYTSRCV